MVWFTGKHQKWIKRQTPDQVFKFLTIPDLMYFDLYLHDCDRVNDRLHQSRQNRENVHENGHHRESDRESDRESGRYHHENARAFHHHHGII